MAVPRNRHSTSRRNNRRAHDAKTPKIFATCPNCKTDKQPHHICPSCGHYKGKAYIATQDQE